ncbi:MAG: universal stress protein [Acidimicrobiales bacterium]
MPEGEDPAKIQKFVVGVDGSDGSGKALDWAVAEAIRSQASLELVTAWMFPMALGYVFAKTPDEVRQQVQRIADMSVAHVEAAAPGVAVRSVLREAEAGPALVELSTGADLLVVGSRGHGGFRELLLGSVGAYCARHAHCPIVIVR